MSTPSDDTHFAYNSPEAHKRWHNPKPIRVVNYDFGYPVLVCHDDGRYQTPEEYLSTHETVPQAPVPPVPIPPHLPLAIDQESPGRIGVGDSKLHGRGVFALQAFPAGSFISTYNGTVYTEEEWDEHKADGEFAFYIHDGASGVVLDGAVGPGVNPMKHINHSCNPNAYMTEVFHNERWYVVVVAIRDIQQGEEIVHNYNLVTEDEDSDQAKIPCTCGADNCQGTLYRNVDW